MNTKVQQPGGIQGTDAVKLTLAVLIVAAGIFAYYWFDQMTSLVRVGMIVAGIVVGFVIAYSTRFGKSGKHFLDETWFEMRKVVWPTRDETVKTTLVVIGVTIILALLLGLIDQIYKWVILDWLLKLGQ